MNKAKWVVEHEFDNEPTYVGRQGDTKLTTAVKFGDSISPECRVAAAKYLADFMNKWDKDHPKETALL